MANYNIKKLTTEYDEKFQFGGGSNDDASSGILILQDVPKSDCYFIASDGALQQILVKADGYSETIPLTWFVYQGYTYRFWYASTAKNHCVVFDIYDKTSTLNAPHTGVSLVVGSPGIIQEMLEEYRSAGDTVQDFTDAQYLERALYGFIRKSASSNTGGID